MQRGLRQQLLAFCIKYWGKVSPLLLFWGRSIPWVDHRSWILKIKYMLYLLTITLFFFLSFVSECFYWFPFSLMFLTVTVTWCSEEENKQHLQYFVQCICLPAHYNFQVDCKFHVHFNISIIKIVYSTSKTFFLFCYDKMDKPFGVNKNSESHLKCWTHFTTGFNRYWTRVSKPDIVSDERFSWLSLVIYHRNVAVFIFFGTLWIVSLRPRILFGSAKPFLGNLGNTPETPCIKTSSVHINNMWIKQLCNNKV